jgi:hypothetical protein
VLTVRDLKPRRGVMHLRVHGKGRKEALPALHPGDLGVKGEVSEYHELNHRPSESIKQLMYRYF